MRTPLGIATAAMIATAPAFADEIAVVERPGHWTEATVTVDATPEQVYALATDYANWRQTFSDIRSVTVESGGRDDARVRFTSRTLEHTVVVKFDNLPDRALRFVGVKGPPGGRAKGEYVLEPVDGGKRTRITGRLMLDVVGIPAIFVRDSTVRSMRQAKLRRDLGDLVTWVKARR